MRTKKKPLIQKNAASVKKNNTITFPHCAGYLTPTKSPIHVDKRSILLCRIIYIMLNLNMELSRHNEVKISLT